ncbi:hypothetical protein K8089_04590 [Aequorivita sp. F47161]|uniref:Glycerophosphoryl diester phosphodiesterase membrane domain-containing protein n=1 Tax=Aequorivita vitellina TaxID=2874475 RepID=A0A9X1QTX8_9FLAO|nr:hypothetical protein [Aequorivita vitellina]MCG2418290.1 hypothetical protein [Aequorivita vitellina]MCZ4319418.1 hypothetical protein [Aequorivita viscosa]
MNETINFKKQRELGSILTDIFKFIRLNWKLLFELIIKIAGPALLIMLVGFIFYLQSFVGGMGMIETVGAFEDFSTNIILSFLVLMLAGVVYYALLNGVVLHFIKSYIKNGGVVNRDEVIQGVKNDFWKLIGTSFLVAIIVFVGAMFCVIPGIYLGVALSIAFAVVVFENKDVADSISYCFNLIRGEWWATFATLFVTGLLYYIINIVFQVPQYIYFFIKAFTGSQEISADPSSMFDGVYLLLSTIGMIFQYLLYTIIVICSAFIYFNLNEKKNFSGTIEAIDSLGKND